ncbi:venom acid phosphatase Acph-1 [Diachasma alloeum]|uniref:venom acid phosphatase Acph-1 n=1 Tax=Diachasma alloeum TaxID=454923 RepID=UPI000738277C|nr:venom acid phosphatase Acph-1 [Diachasma alloeum]
MNTSVLLSTCVVLFFLIVESQSKGELKFLQAVFRHGDRTPDFLPEWYPTDPYSSKDWYPVPNGGLTNTGKNGAFDLGTFFRQRYDKFLGDSIHPDIVRFFSSHADRTKMSGQLVASGLYPPQLQEKWNNAFDWQPIPLKSAPSIDDAWFYFSSVGLCSNHKKQQELAEKTDPELMKYLENNREFYEFISKHAGMNGTYELAYILYVTITAEIEMGLAAPQWTQGLMPEGKLKNAAGQAFRIRGLNDELKKIGAGVWLKMWLDNIEDFISGKMPKRKALFWSGHDQNVGDLLVALEAFDEPHVPPYNSAIILELHQIDAEYYVKILYKRDLYLEPLFISGCDDLFCRFETFKKKFASILPEDPKKACGELL